MGENMIGCMCKFFYTVNISIIIIKLDILVEAIVVIIATYRRITVLCYILD